jgi:hypothetical protein
MRRAWRAGGAGALAAAAWLARSAGPTAAQTLETARPRTLVVGTPPGARATRIDAARTGLSRTPLPAAGLHVEWRASAGSVLEWEPLVDAGGTAYVVGARGEAVALRRDGTERWRAATGAVDPGPPALLSDDTLVFVEASGVAVAVREAQVRWRARVGKPAGFRPAPLPLEDGGVAIAVGRDLALLDAEGHERGRTSLPEAIAGPLIAAIGRVVAVTASGAVWTWTPGSPEAARAGSFGSPLDDGAGLADEHTLVGVVAGQTTLASVDLARGSGAMVARAVAPGGVWLGPPAMRAEAATLVLLAPTGELAMTVDASGRELSRALLAAHAPAARADAGAPGASAIAGGAPVTLPAASGTPLIVDAQGTVAFATLDGAVGTAWVPRGSREGAPTAPAAEAMTETLSGVCPPTILPGALPRPFPEGRRPDSMNPEGRRPDSMNPEGRRPDSMKTVAGLAPLPPASMVVACRSGSVFAVGGSDASAAPYPTRQLSGKPKPPTL